MNKLALSDAAQSYIHGASDVPLIGSTIGDLFDRVVEAQPEHEALVCCHQQVRYTYRQLQDEANRLARGLVSLGIGKGDRVGIWSPNHAEWVITQLATAKIGAILVNINPAYRVHELEYALQQSGCAALILAPPFKTSNYAALLRDVCPELDAAQPGHVHAARLPNLRAVIAFGDQHVPGAFHWDQVMERAELIRPDELADRQGSLDFDDPINIQYTSGTTGFPKGATLSHHSILNNAFLIGERLRFTPHDRLCVPVPFYHTFGMVLGNLMCFTRGATIVVPAPAFDARATLQVAADEKCTGLYGVPTMFIAELGLPEIERLDLSYLRTGIIGGAPCPIEVMKQIIARMHLVEITIGYGMTETILTFETAIDDSLERRVGTVGRILPQLEAKIVDPATGAIAPRRSAGELCIRGYSVMLGYWDNPEATARAIDGGRWMHTGDLATLDEAGYVNIVGRLKDMVIRGGENVYPREIEEFLYRHPKVKDVQVIGVPDEKYGEELMGWVVLKPDEAATGDELCEFCQGQIAHYKIPRYWKFVESFPMTVTGKVQKFKMREVAIEELDLAQAATIKTA
jgi:fatty-acyl-CoA synthase